MAELGEDVPQFLQAVAPLGLLLDQLVPADPGAHAQAQGLALVDRGLGDVQVFLDVVDGGVEQGGGGGDDLEGVPDLMDDLGEVVLQRHLAEVAVLEDPGHGVLPGRHEAGPAAQQVSLVAGGVAHPFEQLGRELGSRPGVAGDEDAVEAFRHG